MNKESKLEEIRSTYSSLKEDVKNNKLNRITLQQAKIQYGKVTQEIKSVQKRNETINLEELAFYKLQYHKLQELINDSIYNHYPRNIYVDLLIDLFQQKNKDNIGKQMYTIQQVDSAHPMKYHSDSYVENSYRKANQKSQQSPLNQFISFLRQKQNKINQDKPKNGFKNVLDKPPLSKRNFNVKNKYHEQQQLENLMKQNSKLKKMFEEGSQTENKRNDYLRQLQYKIKELSQYNERVQSNLTYQDYDQNQSPYIVRVKQNNLQRIKTENEVKSKVHSCQQSQQDQQRSNFVAVNIHQVDNYTEFGKDQNNQSENNFKSQIYQYKQNNHKSKLEVVSHNNQHHYQPLYDGNYFQSYIKPKYMEKSPFIIRNAFRGIQDPITCSRNKVSFFKQSMIIVDDKFCEIGFKTGYLNPSLNQLTIVFFVRNKSTSVQLLHIGYKDESYSYRIDVEEKITTIQPYQQKKQTITITLNNSTHLDCIVDGIFQFTQISKNTKTVYQLWVPASFINFDSKYRHSSLPIFSQNQQDYQRRTIKPDPQFRSYQQSIQAGLPLTHKQQSLSGTSAWIYGQSQCYQGGVKITWSGRSVMIEGSQKWVDWIGFILCKYKRKE